MNSVNEMKMNFLSLFSFRFWGCESHFWCHDKLNLRTVKSHKKYGKPHPKTNKIYEPLTNKEWQ